MDSGHAHLYGSVRELPASLTNFMASESPRSLDRLRHHYEVERELAARLRKSTREERTTLFATLYGELFDRVPDHPRLTRRDTPADSRRKVASQMRLLAPFLKPDSTLLEFAPGDCRLAAAAAAKVKKVIGVDISDQRSSTEESPANLELVVYDGYQLDVAPQSVDICFSYQFLEHLHPDDIDPHFQIARRVLKPGGVYVFDTPHRYTGPHDISAHFTDKLECFHFQEWTHREMRKLLKKHGFSTTWVFRFGKPQRSYFANALVDGIELLMSVVPHKLRRKLCQRILPSVGLVAVAD